MSHLVDKLTLFFIYILGHSLSVFSYFLEKLPLVLEYILGYPVLEQLPNFIGVYSGTPCSRTVTLVLEYILEHLVLEQLPLYWSICLEL